MSTPKKCSDAWPLNTAELVIFVRKHLSRPACLLRPPHFLPAVFKRARTGLYKRLYGSFIVDNASTNESLNFTSPFSIEAGIAVMAERFKLNTER